MSSSDSKYQKPCRNIALYGWCKYENNGCLFQHPKNDSESSEQSQPVNIKEKEKSLEDKKLRVTASSFKPQAFENIPSFVPTLSNNFAQLSTNDEEENKAIEDMTEEIKEELEEDDDEFFTMEPPMLHSQPQPDEQGYLVNINTLIYDPGPLQPLAHHVYTPIANLKAHPSYINSFFMEEPLRRELTEKLEKYSAPLDPLDPKSKGLPAQVQAYHSLQVLDQQSTPSKQLFGHPCHMYRAVNSNDGQVVVLCRLEGFLLPNEQLLNHLEVWTHLFHPNIVHLKEVFISRAFHDESVIFVYQYYPNSKNLLEKYFQPIYPAPNAPPTLLPLPIEILWQFILQITCAIKVIHQQGFACRVLSPTKLLITGENRVRLNCLGIFDLISPLENQNQLLSAQQDDLLSFGQLVLIMACQSLAALQDMNKSLEFLALHYPPDLKNIVLYLLSKPSPLKKIDDFMNLLTNRLMSGYMTQQMQYDYLENEALKELENGRLFRIMTKLGFINERPEFDKDPNWSETGDRYLLKLFRDYVFHQVDAEGNPVLNLGHVVTCLNKLDAGSEEKLILISRDNQSCLICSFKDLKRCAEKAFGDLLNKNFKK